MGRRRQERFEQKLTIKIAGTDSQRNPFCQTASVVNVSERGVRLEGVGVLDRPGQIVTLEHGGQQAKYRVVWVGTEELAGQAGLTILEPQNPVFKGLPQSAPDRFLPPPPQPVAFEDALSKRMRERRQAERRQEERRKYQRYACNGEVDLYSHNMEHPDHGRLTDLSRGGCFVEMMAPIPMETQVQLVMRIADREIRGEGVVKCTLPSFGVGIQFLQFEEAQRVQLDVVIGTLEQGKPLRAIPGPPQPAPATQAGVAESGTQQTLMGELLAWFGSNEVLSREQFLALLGKRKP